MLMLYGGPLADPFPPRSLLFQAQDGEIPHLLFYGPSGAGKKTRIMCLLREIFGPGVEKVRFSLGEGGRQQCLLVGRTVVVTTVSWVVQMRLEHKQFKTTSNRSVELTILASAYHQEINAADVGSADRFVVQEVIKEIASSYNPASLGTPNHRHVSFSFWQIP